MREETEKCVECKEVIFSKEIEVYGEFHDVGGYCDNEKCGRYKILLA